MSHKVFLKEFIEKTIINNSSIDIIDNTLCA